MRAWKGVLLVLAWLGALACGRAAADELLVVRGDEDYPPFERRVDGRVTGLHAELVEAAAARLGLRLRWQSLPWKRALREVELGRADAVTYIARTPEREAWAVFLEGNLLSTAELRLVALKGREPAYDGALEAFLARHKPIVLRGFRFGIAALDQSPRFEGGNIGELLRMLREGYSAVAVLNWSDFVGAYAGRPEFTEISPLHPPLRSVKNYIAFSAARHHHGLAHRFAAALQALQAGPEHQDRLRRYGLAP